MSQGLTTRGFPHLEDEVLQDIKATLDIFPNYGIPTEELFSVRYRIFNQDQTFLLVRDAQTGGGFFLDAPQRVFVLEHVNWLANPRLTRRPGSRGRYLYAPAVILLHENGDNHNSWCRKTLIHEILHSTSLYSRIWDRFPNVVRLHDHLIEGITECLVGYILLNRHPECYEGWKESQRYRCSISYRPRVRLWCSFCQCVGIKDLAEFYLSSQENPSDAWNQLVQSIHGKGFTKFNFQLNPQRAFNESQFRQVCNDSFSDFGEIYESLTRCLDFSRIPQDKNACMQT